MQSGQAILKLIYLNKIQQAHIQSQTMDKNSDSTSPTSPRLMTNIHHRSGDSLCFSQSPSAQHLQFQTTVSNLQNYEKLQVSIRNIKNKNKDQVGRPVKKSLILKQQQQLKMTKFSMAEVNPSNLPNLNAYGVGSLSPSASSNNFDREKIDNRYNSSMRMWAGQQSEQAGAFQYNQQNLNACIKTNQIHLKSPLKSKGGAATKTSLMLSPGARKIKQRQPELREQITHFIASKFGLTKPYVRKTHLKQLKNQSPQQPEDSISRNTGIQRILQQTMRNQHSLNYEFFTKSETVEQQHSITNKISPNYSPVSSHGPKDMFKSFESQPKLPFLSQTNSRQEEEEEKAVIDLQMPENSTMSQHYSMAADEFQKGGREINSQTQMKAKISHQTIALSMRLNEMSKYKPDHNNRQRRTGSMTNPLSPVRTAHRTYEDFQLDQSARYKSTIKTYSSKKSIYIEDDDISAMPEIATAHPLEKLFQTFDATCQSKVMRLTQDSERKNRFIKNMDRSRNQRQQDGRASQLNQTAIVGKNGRESSFLAIKEEVEKEETLDQILNRTGIPQMSKLNTGGRRELNQTVLSFEQRAQRKPIGRPKIDPDVYEKINTPVMISELNTQKQSPAIKLKNQKQPQKVEKAPSKLSSKISILRQPSKISFGKKTQQKRTVSTLDAKTTKITFGIPKTSNATSLLSKQGPQSELRSLDSDNYSSGSSSSGVDINMEDISLSAQQKDLETIDFKTNGYINRLLAETQKNFVNKNNQVKKDQRVMHGRSQYEFPTIEQIEKHQEDAAQIELEDRMGAKFGENPSLLGLAMVDQEKRVQEQPRANSNLDHHAQFLTGDEEKLLGDELAIFKENPLYKKPGASYNFYELSDVELQMMADNANQFEKMILYQKINKVANCSKVQESHAEHPEYVYYVECAQDTDLPLPILSHIYGTTLNLANYTLSGGHCQGLNVAAKFLQKNINRVRFDNCGIDDSEMSSLLSAFVQFKDFKSIIYRRNEVHEETLDGLRELFDKKLPYHLQELRISACRMTPDVTTDLIQAVMERSQLKQFELSETELFLDDCEFIAEFITKSRELEELELKSCSMIPQLADIILTALGVNKRLVQVNLSYNNMIDGFNGNNMKSVQESEQKVNDHIFKFLRYNKKLIHLDLTGTNLSEIAILHILPAIKRGKSLQGVHLSGNPGVTDDVKQVARQLLKTHPDEARRQLNLVKFFTPDTLQRYSKQWMRESVKIKHISTGKSLVQNGAVDDKFIDFGSKMILMRKLSHKQEIPGSGQWQLLSRKQDPCWICEREIKGYIFWTPDMSNKSPQVMNISTAEKHAIFDELQCLSAITIQQEQRPVAFIPPVQEGRRSKKFEREPILEKPVIKKDPVICGQFTDWKPRKMMTLYDFLQSKEPDTNRLDYRSIFENLKKSNVLDINNFEECQSHHIKLMDEARKKKEVEVFKDWRILFEKQLTYKKPFFINSGVVREMKDYRNIYVAPVFSRSGRQIFVIQPGDSAESMETYQSVIDFRQEDVPAKSLNASRYNQAVFSKPASVFAKWENDTDRTREKALVEHDFRLWKLQKFVKEHDQKASIEKIYFDNFFFIKSCFVETAASTSWPKVTQLGLYHFCNKSQLIDNKHLSISDIDRIFIASRFDESGDIKGKNIIRFMFFEAVSRIGIKRFYDDGKGECSTHSEALARTFEYLKNTWKFDVWEEWRWATLYKLDVHDILKANLVGLKKLLMAYAKPTKKYLELDDCIRMLLSSTLGLGAPSITYAFGMSQMTTCFEKEKKNAEGLLQLELVEFLEMVGRLARAKFQGSELEEQLKLSQKIDYVLDDILPLVGAERQDPIVEVVSSEESADEY